MGLDYTMSAALLLSCCGFFFISLVVVEISSTRPRVSVLNNFAVSTHGFGVLGGGGELRSSYSAILATLS